MADAVASVGRFYLQHLNKKKEKNATHFLSLVLVELAPPPNPPASQYWQRLPPHREKKN
jgi:hypothetical protein